MVHSGVKETPLTTKNMGPSMPRIFPLWETSLEQISHSQFFSDGAPSSSLIPLDPYGTSSRSFIPPLFRTTQTRRILDTSPQGMDLQWLPVLTGESFWIHPVTQGCTLTSIPGILGEPDQASSPRHSLNATSMML